MWKFLYKKGYKKSTIYEAGTDYKEEFWEKYNSFPINRKSAKFHKNSKRKINERKTTCIINCLGNCLLN